MRAVGSPSVRRCASPARSELSLLLRTTRRSAPRFAGRQALHRHEAYRYAGGGEWTPVAQCARSERPRRRLCRSDETRAPDERDPLEASVRCGWRESSKRSSASVGAGAPFRGRLLHKPRNLLVIVGDRITLEVTLPPGPGGMGPQLMHRGRSSHHHQQVFERLCATASWHCNSAGRAGARRKAIVPRLGGARLDLGESTSEADLLAADVRASNPYRPCVQIHHYGRQTLFPARLSLHLANRSSQAAQSKRCWISSGASQILSVIPASAFNLRPLAGPAPGG